MKQFTSEEIQNQFEKLPKELQDALTSQEIQGKIRETSDKHGLLIDQFGELMDEIGLVMLGLRKSSDFVSAISSRLSINSKLAQEITEDINREVFTSIKNYLQKIELDNSEVLNRVASVERVENAGNFIIESEKEGAEPSSINLEDRDSILSGIENPPLSKQTFVPKMEEMHTESIVDHLLSAPTAQPEQKIVRKMEETTENTESKPAIIKSSGVDPYREAAI